MVPGLEDRRRYEDVELVHARAVAYFRANAGGDLADPATQRLIDDVWQQSEEFRRLWSRHDVLSALSGEGPNHIHPVVGPMLLRFQTLAPAGAGDPKLFVVTAAPGSREARALAELARITQDRAA